MSGSVQKKSTAAVIFAKREALSLDPRNKYNQHNTREPEDGHLSPIKLKKSSDESLDYDSDADSKLLEIKSKWGFQARTIESLGTLEQISSAIKSKG